MCDARFSNYEGGRRASRSRGALLCLVILGLGLGPARGLDPQLPPGSNFDLTHWKLTLPLAGAPEISAALLTAGYSNASFFYTGPAGEMVFWCPVTGGTTSGSSYPRSELREMLNPTDSKVNWTGHGTHSLDAQCRVLRTPSTGKVIIGQIHGYSGNAYPLIKLQYFNGLIDALVKHSPNSSTDTHYYFMNVGLSNLITYQIKVADGLLSMTVNGSNRAVNIFQTDPDWANQTMYYKAGNYCQDNAGDSTEGSLVVFEQLSVSHATNTVRTIAPPTNLRVVNSATNPPVVTNLLPAQVLNLANWKLTLPVNTAHAGAPDEYLQPELATFVDPNYFYVNATSNGVVFTAHAGGYTTSGSGYPRSELREMVNNGTTLASWSTTSGTHSLIITQAITHLPEVKQHVVVGQIHDASDDVIVFRLESKKLFIDENGNDGPVLTTNYNLGDIFTVQFLARNGGVECYYNGNYVYTYTVSASGCYFKVGCYTQSNTSKGDLPTAYGQVVVYGTSVTHQ
jgi:hypothetical protein